MKEKANMTTQPKLWSELTSKEQKEAIASLKALPNPKNGKVEKPSTGQFNLRGYVHCDLAKSDRELFEGWAATVDDAGAFDKLMKLADSGYLVKLGANREGFQATLSAYSVRGEVDGFVLTAFAGDAARAVRLLLFKHYVQMAEDWTPYVLEGGDDFLR
jgi:hypothetical protein